MAGMHRARKLYFTAAVVLAAAVLLITGSFYLLPRITEAGRAAPLQPEQIVEQAWQRARQLGEYKFTTDLEAAVTKKGQPVHTNSARHERLYIEGNVDLPAQKLEMTLWEKGGKVFNTRQGIQVKVEDGKTLGRVGSGEWQEMEDATDAFAPGQDPMAFLAGAKDFYLAGNGTVDVPTLEGTTQISYSRYGFTVDGIQFAQRMRSQLERQLAESGELPPGASLDTSEAFRDLSGQGEVWIDAAGLPLRLILDLAYPEQYGEQTQTRVKTDFSGYPEEDTLASSLLEHPLEWAGRFLSLPSTAHGWERWAIQAGLLAGCLLLVLVVVICSRSKKIYIAIASAVILSMLVSPLWEGHQVQAYNERVRAQQKKAEAQQVKQAAQALPVWDPLQDPLAVSAAPLPEFNAREALAQPQLSAGGVQAAALVEEPPTDPDSDTDLDGLTYQEEMRLGTDPTMLNSDMDELGDGLEVRGFDYQGSHYYTDPRISDTTGDGLLDTMECWNTAPTTLPTNDIGCDLDTDLDGSLDVFETDNDNDGVADSVDLSPFSAMDGFYDGSPFQLIINKLQQEPVLVDLQIRPTNPEHLAYTMSVLDWPTGDIQGQVQRVLGNTFATAVDDPMTPEEIASDPRVQYGDMRLIPMLEISVPYKAGHTRNMPVKPGYTGTIEATTPLEDWLDQDKLDKYGMSAHYLDETGGLAIYAPLNLVSDEAGGSNVAFQTRLYYEPLASGDWGNSQQVRVIWWVQVLADQCDSSAYDENTDGEFEEWCAKPENRIESSQIVHTYPEQWSLTGLSVREDHGLETAVAFEAPDYDANVDDDDYLWKLAYGMDSAFIAARDCDPVGLDGECMGDGQRDITLNDIERRFDNRYNSDIPNDDPSLWNIPKTSLQVWKEEFPHQDYMITMVTTTTRQILEDKFLPVGGCQNNCGTPRAAAPTLLYATEAHARTANLDLGGTAMGWGGTQLTVDMDPANIPLDTVATMSWSPFRYVAGEWEVYPLDEYIVVFDERLENYFPIDPLDPESEDEAYSQRAIAFGYYMGMTQGTVATVQSDDTVTHAPEAINDLVIFSSNLTEAVKRTVSAIWGVLQRIQGKGTWKVYSAGDAYEWQVTKGRNTDELPFGSKGIIFERNGGTYQMSTLAERVCALAKVGMTVLMGLVAVTFMFLSLAIDDPPLSMKIVQNALMAAGGIVLFSIGIKNLKIAREAGNFSFSLSKFRSSFKDFRQTTGFKLALVGLAVDLATQLALFVFTMATSSSEMSGWEIAANITYFVITVIVTILLFILFNIPVIGDILNAFVTIINAIFNIICAVLGEDFKNSAGGVICKGVAGLLGNALFKIIYSAQTLPYFPPEEEDEGDDGGLVQSSPDVTMVNPDEGYKQGAQLSYSFNLTNTLRLTADDELDNWKARQWSFQFSEKNLKKSAFDFKLSSQEDDPHKDLYLGKQKDWISLGNRNGVPWVEDRRALSNQQYFTLSQAGINQAVATYYNEGYDLPLQTCWGWPPISGCGIASEADSGHSEIGQYFLYDVFPANLDGFHTLQAAGGGYRLAWGGSSLPFPVLRDADGDGLAVGSDPGDGRWDFDQDGLSDVYELQIGTNPRAADNDRDGLSDRQELIYGSDPNSSDGDHDSLTDQQELTGWDFAYGWVDEKMPKTFRVKSNPAMYDSDLDGVSDYKEWLYGWNPNVFSEGDVLTFSSDLTERDASGQYSITDGVVRNGDQLRYAAEVKNELDMRYMRGLLSANYPVGSLSGSVDPRAFVLAPRESAAIQGDLSVTAPASGPLELTQIAGAELYDAQALSNYATLLLHLEDPAGATAFLDESGSMPPHHGACLPGECPTSQVPGSRGMGVRFTQPGQKISVSSLDVSRGSLGVSMWISTTLLYQSLFISQNSAVQLSINSGGAACAEVQTTPAIGRWCSGTPINNGQWHYLALSYDASTTPNVFSFYVDGTQIAAISASARRAYTSDMLGVDYGVNYTGDMDETAIYNRALTESEIKAAVNSPDLYARLDEPANAQAFVDVSGLSRGYCGTPYCPKMGVPGMIRSAAEFDGVDDRIFFAGAPSLYFPTSQDFTVALWAKVSAQTDMTLIKWGDGSAPYPFQISYIASTHTIRVKRQDRSNHTATINASVAIDDGQFHHVAFVKQGARLYLYIDGWPRGDVADPCTGDTLTAGQLILGEAAPYENYFNGQLDEFRIYRRGFPQAEVRQLVDKDLVPLHLHFDDPPGTYQFQEYSGLQSAVCLSSLEGCPTSGVPGRRNQAAEFDGVDDFLDAGIAPAVSGTGPLSLGAWVRTTSTGRDQVIVNQRSAAVYNGEYMFGTTAQGTVYWLTYGNSGAAGFSLYSTRTVNDGKWHHVVAVREQDGSARIYIDGTQDAYLAPTTIASLVPTNVYIAADVRDHAQYFDGTIDELQIRRYALSAYEVGVLQGWAPRFQLHLEENAGSSSFADDTEQGHDATCSAEICPRAGVDGQVGLAAEFDGIDDGIVSNFTLVDHAATIMAWVQANSNIPGVVITGDRIPIPGYPNPYPSFELFQFDGSWKVGSGRYEFAPADAVVRVGEWQHLAVRITPYTFLYRIELFVNGVLMSGYMDANLFKLINASVGYYQLDRLSRSFDGRIDEVAVYDYALTTDEIQKIFRYQSGWVQQVKRTGLTVDNDPPGVEVKLPAPVISNQPIQLRIETSDATTSVSDVQWRVNGGTWNTAPACQGADLAAAWCPTFTPSGAGTYTLQAYATDRAGNTSATASATLQVDNAAPTVSLAQEGGLVPLQAAADQPNAWIAALSGTVTDPAPSSGVASVRVALIDPQGVPVSGDSQSATVSGGSWSINYVLSEPLMSGQYTVALEAEDNAGNHGADRGHSIQLDRSAPEAAFDGPLPGGALALWHLNETVGATRFFDSSGLGNDALCDLSCPVAGVAGKYGTGINFTDGRSLKTSRALTVGESGLALSAWFQTSATSQGTLFAVTDSTESKVITVKLDGTGRVVYSFSPPSVAATSITTKKSYNNNAWHHLSAQWQPGQIQLFLDGQLVRTVDSVAGSIPAAVNVVSGHDGDVDLFVGNVDEIAIHGVQLTSSEVRSLAFLDPSLRLSQFTLQGTISELKTVPDAMLALHLEETASPFVDSSNYDNDAVCTGASCPTVDSSGPYGASRRFDGSDDGLSIPSTSMNYLTNDLTVMAWVKPERLTGVQRVLSLYRCSGGGGLGFGLNGSALNFTPYGVDNLNTTSVMTANTWQHIAAVLEADNTLTFYRNGVVVVSGPGSAPAPTCLGDIQIGRSVAPTGISEERFQGSIDEVQVFNRALTPEQILAMAQKKNAGIASLEVAYTSDLDGSTRYNAPVLPDTQLSLPLDDSEDAQGNATFLDISGTGHSGTCVQPNCPSLGQSGHTSSAAMFEGTDVVTIPARPSDVSNDYYTISAWIYPIGTPDTIDTFLARSSWALMRYSSGNIFWVIRSSSAGNTWVNSGIHPEVGKWTHIAIVFDAGVVKSYANGALKSTYPTPPNRLTGNVANASTLNVGAWPAYSHYYSGGIDQVNLISRALTDSEIMALYLGTEPVVRLPFDQSWADDGSLLVDESGWGHDAMLNSGAGDTANKTVLGRVGSGALQLDGVDDNVQVANQTSLNFTANQDFSVSLWVKADTQVDTGNADNDIVEKWSGSGGYPYALRYSRSDGKIVAARSDGSHNPVITSSAAINDDQFHHIAFVRQGGSLYLYIDGVQQGTVSDTTTGDTTNTSPLLIGMRGNNINYFKGTVDDLLIYARALSVDEVRGLYDARWQAATLTESGSTVMRTAWNTSLPAGLEGHYQFDLRTQDTYGNHVERRGTWNGVLDTTAPRATLTYEGGPTTYTLRFYAQDLSLDETKLQTPCPSSTTVNKIYFNPPWFRALTGVTTVNSTRLYSLDGSCQVTLADPTQASLTVSDLYGNQTVVHAAAAVTAFPNGIQTAANAPLDRTTAVASTFKPTQPGGQVLILTPAPGAVLNDLQPVTITGSAQADEYLKRLTVSVDGKKVFNQKWDKREVQTYDWSATWQPTTAGTHLIEAELTDWMNAVFTHSVTFTLDTQAPNLTIATAVLTTTHVVISQLPIQGTATDENGIALVEVQVEAQGYTSGWMPATLDGDAWQALVYPGHDFRPDDESLTIHARATDRSGLVRTIGGNLTADLQVPSPVDLDLSYEDINGIYPITQTGTILTGNAPILNLRWSPSSDGSGLSGYRAGWIIRDASGVIDTTADFGSDDERLASYQATEAQQLNASVASVDQYGNKQSQAFGPIYVDSPLTPDYIYLDEGGETYHGWMEGSCSLLGQDRRVNKVQPDNATRGRNQALYATWDTQALRLAWTGANWSGDGDLFVYLDTMTGGTLDAMNPYTSTVATIQLPGVLPLGPRPNAMYADYIVWVQDDQTAWLYRWDGDAWQAETQLAATQYQFDASLNGGTTDLYLPFELLGVAEPENTPLKLVAFATEEGSLSLWATLPQSNPVTSPFVTNHPQAEQVYVRFALNHPFSWEGLRSGTCPNGSQAQLPGQRQYTDDDLQISVTADPVGGSYRYLGDHMFGWWLTLLQDRPAEFSSLLAALANELDRVQDGQEISYTINYKNDGAQTAQDVILQVRSRLALKLPDGVSLEPEEHAYYQEIPIGDVAPGQTGTVTVRGAVDLEWAEIGFQECLNRNPAHPLACVFNKRWTLFSIQVFDQAHPPADGPRELMWVDHRVDSEAPLFAGFHSGRYGLSFAANNILQGYAFDESGVEELTLEIEAPDGSTRQLVCNDPSPLDGQWNCSLDLDAAAQDGDEYRVRIRARDRIGLVGAWSPWQSFVVDRTAPEVEVGSTPTSTLYSPPLNLSSFNLNGLIQDNVGVRGVEVCQGAECDTALTQFPAQEWSYADALEAPMAIGSCGGEELVRSFTVPDSYSVGEIRLGFQAEISNRDNLVVELTSPAGTRIQVIGDDYDLSTIYDNLNVILSDRVGAGLSALRASQALTSGGFASAVRPLQPLASFKGQSAAGTWQLSVCQEGEGGDPALYHGAQLWAEPPNTAPLSGAWQSTHRFEALDDEEQTLLVYGIDEAGNRSPEPQVLTFRIDNVTPVMTVTEMIPQLTILPDLSPQTVLAGSVSDGGQVVRMHAYVRDPDGISQSLRPVVNEDLAWQVRLEPMMEGSYAVWVAAEDEAGNMTTVGPFSVEVAGIPEIPSESMPEITVTPTATITATLTPAPTTTITPVVTITDTLTPVPQPTATITATLTPTPTTTITATVTITATLTPVPQPSETPTPPPPPADTEIPPPAATPPPSIKSTLEGVPGVSILPLLAQVSGWMVKPARIPNGAWSWFW